MDARLRIMRLARFEEEMRSLETQYAMRELELRRQEQQCLGLIPMVEIQERRILN